MFRIIAKSTLRAFWERYPDSEKQLRDWHHATEKADWQSPAEVKNQYDPKASILKNGRIVFDIVGGKYRLVVQFNFEFRVVLVRFVGTHAEYDKIDANTVIIKKE